jgi:hypothetical protein
MKIGNCPSKLASAQLSEVAGQGNADLVGVVVEHFLLKKAERVALPRFELEVDRFALKKSIVRRREVLEENGPARMVELADEWTFRRRAADEDGADLEETMGIFQIGQCEVEVEGGTVVGL